MSNGNIMADEGYNELHVCKDCTFKFATCTAQNMTFGYDLDTGDYVESCPDLTPEDMK